MHADRNALDAVIEGWRRQGAGHVDPLRFARITALQRRAATRTGATRRRLEATLAAMVDAYARMLGEAAGCTAHDAHAPDAAPRSALGALVETMHARLDADAAAPVRYPELAALARFQSLWSTLRTGRQVRTSLAQAPTGAGPLNSAALAHRALTLMGGLSPEYLRQFLAYVDTLSWLESLQDTGVLTGREAAPPAGAKPRKPRARKRN